MDYIVIFGKQIPAYGLLGATGFILGMLYLVFACKRTHRSVDDALYVLIWGGLMAMFGAKLLYIIVELGNIIDKVKAAPDEFWSIVYSYIAGGFVFYGGLIGGLLGIWLACKFFKLNLMEQMNQVIPVLALVHAFGRLGCHTVGCCYGCEFDGAIAIQYTTSNYAPNGVNLFPVQLIESLFEFTLFAFFLMVVILRKEQIISKFIYIYLISYSCVRFVLEFFRGDAYRGSFLGVSTSQWISIGIWVVLIVLALRARRKKNSTQQIG